jgi:hypothetical protein
MVHIRPMHMAGSHTILHDERSRWWRQWLDLQMSREDFERARVKRQQHPPRHEVGIPIGRHWQVWFSW